MRHFRHAGLADHRLEQALRIVHVIEAEAAFDAKPVLIGRAVLAGDGDDLVVLDLVSELAADAAIGADAVDHAVGLAFIDVVVVDHGRRHQRAGRASLHAFAASHAGRVAHRIVEVEHDLLAKTAARHADDVVDLHFAAGADAEIALDAGVEIDRHGDVAAVRRGRGAARQAALLELHAGRNFPELGIRIVGDVAGRLVGQQQLRHHLARGLGAVGGGLDLHAGRRVADAACRQHPLALDLDHADPAIAVRPVAGFRRIAQMRQLDAEPARGVEDGLAGADIDFAVVDQKGVGSRASVFLFVWIGHIINLRLAPT